MPDITYQVELTARERQFIVEGLKGLIASGAADAFNIRAEIDALIARLS